jgi:uncharacterized protein YbjT (DUF2867 family)
MAKVLITGSTGFIGKRLLYKILEQGHDVYALSRIKGIDLNLVNHPRCHILYGDLRERSPLSPFPKDIDVAYYLVHSMGSIVQNLEQEEEQVTRNFISAIEQTACKQIIFLGGIIEDPEKLSSHLRSRLTVEKILQGCRIPTTILRSSIIIGAGSASFEIIRDLVEKLPFMIAPRWVKSYCQPIAVKDVIYYLYGLMLNPPCFGQTYDIGGPESMTFKDVLLRYAAFRKLKRYILDVPLLTPRLSSYWLVFITSVRFSICSYLVESMKQNTRKLNHAIDNVLPHQCLSYEDSLRRAFQLISQNAVVSTWMDAWDLKKLSGDIQDFIEVPQEGCLKDIKIMPITVPIDEVQKKIWSIGGEKGWYSLNWAWRLRGLIDQMVGGTGLNRGRRHPTHIEIGDSIDFWRVLLASEKKRHLILYAEMKLPGEAWLEFKIDEEKKVLIQTATFRPKGFFGRLYWYFLFPFHLIIFKNMAKKLAQ